MTEREGILSVPGTPGSPEKEAAALWALTERRARLFTAGDSTSLREETAQELLESIRFTLRLALETQPDRRRLLLTADGAEELLADGQRIIRSRTELCRRLWQAVCVSAPKLQSASLRDTLTDIGAFFRRYDWRFLAHRVPCTIDYPLCLAVSEEKEGVDYLLAYLQSLLAENRLLAQFPAAEEAALLTAASPIWKSAPLNLCQPVLTAALGRELTRGGAGGLSASEEDRRRLSDLLGADAGQARETWSLASRRLCAYLSAKEEAYAAEYLTRAAADLLPGVRQAVLAGGVIHAFPTF
jgi:hypothetical protein